MVFEEVYAEYVDAVYSFLIYKLNNPTLAEDLLQETFLAVYKAIKADVQVTAPRAWVFSIAHNKMVDHLRKNKGAEVEMLPEILSDQACEHTSNLFFWDLLKQLNDQERTIIYGLYAIGLSCQELGWMLQIPEGTVKSRAYYARQKLRRWLGGVSNE